MLKYKEETQLLAAFILIIIISYGISSYIQSHRVLQSQIIYNISNTPPSISEYSVLLDENFEYTNNGSLPHRFVHSGDSHDQAYVVYDSTNRWTKSLYIHEHGGDYNNSIVKIGDLEGKNILLDFYYMINGSSADRHVFQFYNEDDEPCVGMNTRVGDPWRYKTNMTGGKGMIAWLSIPGFDLVECGRLYHIQIFADCESQMVVFGVDGIYSECLPSQRPWNTITSISFRGNLNYPADGWYDNVVVIEYKSD